MLKSLCWNFLKFCATFRSTTWLSDKLNYQISEDKESGLVPLKLGIFTKNNITEHACTGLKRRCNH